MISLMLCVTRIEILVIRFLRPRDARLRRHTPTAISIIVCRTRVFFFFQAEDGIRDLTVTGVQTCALPISGARVDRLPAGTGMVRFTPDGRGFLAADMTGVEVWDLASRERVIWHPAHTAVQIGRASCRERV